MTTVIDMNYGFQTLSREEQQQIDGGVFPFLPALVAIAAGVTAIGVIFNAGKAVGDYLYHALN